MLLAILMVIVLLGLSYMFYDWATANNNYFEARGIRQMTPRFLVGNNGGVYLQKYTVPEFAMRLYKQFPDEKVFGYFDVRNPIYYIRDLELIKRITVKDFDHFEDHSTYVDASTDQLFGNSLFLSRGKKWRDMRATLSPAFTGSKMRLMFELVSECADELIKCLLKTSHNGTGAINWEMKELSTRYANDVIASCAFGIKVNSLENRDNEFYQIGSKSLDFSGIKAVCKFLLMRMVPSVMKALGYEIVDNKVVKFFQSMVTTTMDIRERNGIYRPDMINILMQHRKGSKQNVTASMDEIKGTDNDGFATVQESHIGQTNQKRQWEEIELVAQCFLFFLAGFETVSTQLTFIAYELMVNKEIEERLYEEIVQTNETLNGKRIDYDTLQKMKYMDQIISESLRKWPSQAVFDRVCVKDFSYEDKDGFRLRIDKGYFVNVPLYGLHHDPKYFPDPDTFNPERFNDANKHKIVPGSYIPFGMGPRACIGSRFALIELKAFVYYLLLNFSLRPNEKSQIPIVLKKNTFSMATEKGVHIELKPRNH